FTLTGGKVLHHNFGGRLAEDIDQILLDRTRSPRPPEGGHLPKGWSKAWDWGKFPESDNDMGDHKLALKAAEALKQNFDQPFFMSVGFFRPHVPLFAPAKWFDLYDPDTLVLAHPHPGDMDDIPKNFQSINDYAVAPTHQQVVKTESHLGLTHAYLASVSFVDHCVGIVIDALASSKHADNTIVVLWSDHGFHLGEKHHWAKRTLWEESTKVPLLITMPKLDAGECIEPASLIDIFPTLTELCKIPAPKHLEGISLMPQLNDPQTTRLHPAITSSYYGNHAIRTRNFRLIRYEDGAEELYDHRTDPNEHTNLINTPGYQATREQLAEWLPKNAAEEFKQTSERERNKKK
ncbi:MAG: sulfatase-like hydrolase/transferase, partial [Verrucomicrobiota bacterium]